MPGRSMRSTFVIGDLGAACVLLDGYSGEIRDLLAETGKAVE